MWPFDHPKYVLLKKYFRWADAQGNMRIPVADGVELLVDPHGLACARGSRKLMKDSDYKWLIIDASLVTSCACGHYFDMKFKDIRLRSTSLNSVEDIHKELQLQVLKEFLHCFRNRRSFLNMVRFDELIKSHLNDSTRHLEMLYERLSVIIDMMNAVNGQVRNGFNINLLSEEITHKFYMYIKNILDKRERLPRNVVHFLKILNEKIEFVHISDKGVLVPYMTDLTRSIAVFDEGYGFKKIPLSHKFVQEYMLMKKLMG